MISVKTRARRFAAIEFWDQRSPNSFAETVRMEVVTLSALSVQTVSAIVRDALAATDTVETIADFLAAVDWSNAEQADAGIRAVLGHLEEWDSEVREGDLEPGEYFDRLRSLVATRERLPGGAVVRETAGPDSGYRPS